MKFKYIKKKHLILIISALVFSLFLFIQLIMADSLYDFILQWGGFGSLDGQLIRPTRAVVDASGDIYVIDTNNYRVQKFDSVGNHLDTWGSVGTGDGELAEPRGIAIHPNGNIYIADSSNFRVQVFEPDGTFLFKWGSSGIGDGQFDNLCDLAIDTTGNVYVADTQNNRVQKFDTNGNFITKWGGPSAGSGDGEFNNPCGIGFGPDGNVYVADSSNHRIQKFDPDGNFLLKWGVSGIVDGRFNNPWDVGFDSDGNVYVVEQNNHRVQVFDYSGNFIGKWGSRGGGNGLFYNPTGVDVDSDGYIYVADSYNHLIQKFGKALAPPETMIYLDPAFYNGENGWYVSIPTVTLVRNEPGITYYSWDSSTGPWTTYSGPFLSLVDRLTIYYYSEDTDGLEEDPKNYSWKVDNTYPSPALLQNPPDGTSTTNIYPYFSWEHSTDTISQNVRYTLQVSTSNTFPSYVLEQAGLADNYYQTYSALTTGTYYWRVWSKDEAGNKTPSTSSPPGPPISPFEFTIIPTDEPTIPPPPPPPNGNGDTTETPPNGTPDTTSPEIRRIGGKDRYETARLISHDDWTSSGYAIVARGDIFPEALTGAPLARSYNCPILLTLPNSLNEDTRYELNRLGVHTCIILGETGAVSNSVKDEILRNTTVSQIIRIGGIDRYETAQLISERLEEREGKVTTAVVATGLNWPDALTMSPVAGYLGYPILLVKKDTLTTYTEEALENLETTKTLIVGGTGVVSSDLQAELPNPVRIAGSDRYETAAEVYDYAISLGLLWKTILIATAYNFPDALCGGAYGARVKAFVLLSHPDSLDNSPETKDIIQTHKDDIDEIIILGGTGAVSDTVKEQLEDIYF